MGAPPAVSPYKAEMLLGEKKPGLSTQIRRGLDCLLRDRFVPAVEEMTEERLDAPEPRDPGPAWGPSIPGVQLVVEQHLEFVRRGIDLIESVRHEDNRKVMLGCLFRDLSKLRKLGRVASPETRSSIRSLVKQAHELSAQSGGPVEPDVPESEEVKDDAPCRGDAPALWERRRFPRREPEGGGTPPPAVQGLREDREGVDRARDSPARGRIAESADEPPPRESESKAEVSALVGSRRYLHFRKAHPEAEIWVRAGLTPRAAKALAKAGILTLADLQERSKEEILALRGLGHAQLRKCELLLGHELPSRPNYWVAKGLPGLAAASLGRAGLQTIDDLEGMTREQLLFLPGVGEVVLRHCERLLGHAIPSVAPYWIEQGFGLRIARVLARAGLRDIRQLRELKTAELRRIGLTKANLSSVLGILPWPNLEDKGISDARPF